MAKIVVDDSYITNIAAAIRSKLGVTTKYKTSEMATAIKQIFTKKDTIRFDVATAYGSGSGTTKTFYCFYFIIRLTGTGGDVYKIDWGDGNTSTGAIAGNGHIDVLHQYTYTATSSKNYAATATVYRNSNTKVTGVFQSNTATESTYS